mgnify:CR=1 FL=1
MDSTDKLTAEEYIDRVYGSGYSSANSKQIAGTHYKSKQIQPWDFIAANNLDFFQGNIIKYVVRFRDKNGKQDLEKAKHYLEKLIEIEYGNE